MSIWLKKHQLFPNEILVRDFSGEVGIDQILNSWNLLLRSRLLTDDTIGVINNLVNCELKLTIESFGKLTDFLKLNPRLRELKLAVVTDKPNVIVFPMMGEVQQKILKIKPFTTEEAAINWIMERSVR
ncbi:MAG TPA: hypothetical protein P5514_10935 [Bacteroidales bacterium]|nr:STAS/SEC14 domain-containing protein [Bacteroidales bacterium]HPE58375.1 hypothetical protein [Bacteroidales bacterium]HRX97451.1 hypothetical protein [Bacteroidales bacterium]